MWGMLKKWFEKVTEKGFLNWLKRHWYWLVIGAVSFYKADFAQEEIKTLAMITFYEFFALILSGFAHTAYTRLDLVSKDINDDRHLLGTIFMAVHIMVALSLLGIYIVQFSAGR